MSEQPTELTDDEPDNVLGETLRRLPFVVKTYGNVFEQLTTELEQLPHYSDDCQVFAVGNIVPHLYFKNGKRRGGECYCTFIDAAGHHVEAHWVMPMVSLGTTNPRQQCTWPHRNYQASGNRGQVVCCVDALAEGAIHTGDLCQNCRNWLIEATDLHASYPLPWRRARQEVASNATDR